MSDDSATDERRTPRRPRKNADSGNSVVKILLIVFGSLAGLAILGCCGTVGVFYFVAQQALKDADLKNPADIQRVTAEMTDITIPPEFVPKQASSVFFVKTAQYEWCPTGTCAVRDDGMGKLTLSSINLKNQQAGQATPPALPTPDVSDESLKATWRDYTKSEHEFDIRGRKCRFTIIQGEHTGFTGDVDSEMENDPSDPQPADNTPEGDADKAGEPSGRTATPATGLVAGRKSVQITGQFPGKQGECTLAIELAPDQYDEEKILQLLKSIR